MCVYYQLLSVRLLLSLSFIIIHSLSYRLSFFFSLSSIIVIISISSNVIMVIAVVAVTVAVRITISSLSVLHLTSLLRVGLKSSRAGGRGGGVVRSEVLEHQRTRSTSSTSNLLSFYYLLPGRSEPKWAGAPKANENFVEFTSTWTRFLYNLSSVSLKQSNLYIYIYIFIDHPAAIIIIIIVIFVIIIMLGSLYLLQFSCTSLKQATHPRIHLFPLSVSFSPSSWSYSIDQGRCLASPASEYMHA